MKKTLNAIFLLSGTAIGSGMLSLPIVLAKIGVVPIIFIMLLFCALTYFSALVRVELNLQSDKDNTLGKVGLIFSGPKVAWMGDVSLKILMFSLLAAYLYGLSSIIKSIFLENIALTNVVVAVSALLFLLMVSSPQILLNLNKWTIVALITMVTAVVAMMASHFKLESVVWFTRKATNFGTLTAILPKIYTSFGFQGSIHSLTKMCNNDIKLIKTACLWGSIIPATVYIIWTGSVICLLSAKFPDSLATLMSGGIEVSELVTMLTMTCNWKFVKTLLLAVSLTAITTSIFGVGLCLKDDFNTFFKKSLGMR
ncbi:MAG: hypothetical protein LBS87_00975, partial [Puniceicoccales bacterium]|nr:hypothetical protein [Puniceicoccales bacterium]